MPSTLTGRRCAAFFRRVQAILRSMSPSIRHTKGYIMRCLGNSRMSMPRSTPEECTEYMKVFDKAMGIITDPYYHPGLRPGPSVGANSSMRCIWTGRALLSYLRHHNDPVVAAKVMESAEAIYRDRVLYKGEEARLQNWRAGLSIIRRPAIHAGRCTAREVVEELLDIIHHTDIAGLHAILASTRTSRRCLIWWLTRSRCRLPTGGRWHAAPKK